MIRITNGLKYLGLLMTAAAVITLLIVAIFYAGYSKGSHEKDLEWRRIQHDSEIKYEKELQELNTSLIEQQTKLISNNLETMLKYKKDMEDAKIKSDAIINELDNDNRRLWVKVNQTGSSTNGSTSCSNGPGTDGTSRAELSKESSRFLLEIAREADDTARRLNALQDVTRELEAYAANCKVIKSQD